MTLAPYPTCPRILPEPPNPDDTLTHYDLIHGLLFARLLTAAETGLDWREATRTILLRDVDRNEEGARRCWEAHYARACWLVAKGSALAAIGLGPTGDSPDDYPPERVPEDLLSERSTR
ncbi:hypothetical protein [uncultured Sphingomonas sp.]|uniref:hypothetical protein n=1 Tax=uncultured Sphingomonas sp. TaxID=158754 RepID=UPI0035CB1C01